MNDSRSVSETSATTIVQSLLRRIEAGDQLAVRSLLETTEHRLRLLAKKVSTNIPGVKAFEQTDDLLQNSMIRLWRAFETHHPATPLDFYRLASSIMRRELIDLSRHYFGPNGIARIHVTPFLPMQDTSRSVIEVPSDDTSDPQKLSLWTEFHVYIESLDDQERMLFDLLWYQGFNLHQAAEIIGGSERTIRRQWKIARLSLYQTLLEP